MLRLVVLHVNGLFGIGCLLIEPYQVHIGKVLVRVGYFIFLFVIVTRLTMYGIKRKGIHNVLRLCMLRLIVTF